MRKNATRILTPVLAAAVLAACGRNPGANARSYPGTERIEAALAAAQPKCVPLDPKRIQAKATVSGKEKFMTDRKGVFKLDSYRVSQAADLADHSVPNAVFAISEFEDLSSSAPRLAIEAECLDLKGNETALSLSPVTRIDSETGLALQAQPFSLAVDAKGALEARSRVPTDSTSPLPAGKVPEAALLLGAEYAQTSKTLSFTAEETEDGSLKIRAEFIGMDPATLARIFTRVEAVYGWDSAE